MERCVRKLFLTLALLFAPTLAWAQCNGVFQPNTVCGNSSASPSVPGQIAFSASGTVVGPGSSTIGDFALWNNITGTLLSDSGYTTGTSGHSIPFLDGTNIWANTQTFAGINATSIGGTTPGTVVGTSLTGTSFLLKGASSGTISILPQAAAGMYNFNFPTTAGTVGQLLASGGGAGAPMTWTSGAPFTQTGTGAVASTVDVKLKSYALNPKDFGAVCDGVTNDATALQNTINQALVTSPTSTIELPAATCAYSTALSVTGALTIRGSSINRSTLQPATNIDGIDVNTTSAVKFENFAITYASAATGSTKAISVTSSGINSSSIFRDLQILNPVTCFSFLRAQTFVIDNVKCLQFSSVGASIQNTSNPDSGDSTIVNSHFNGTNNTTTVSCIQWLSSGGFRFVNDKCVTSVNGFLIQLASGASTAQMIISNNSFDTLGTTGSAMSFIRLGATGSMARIIINGNLCNGVLVCVQIPNDANGVWLSDVVITNNIYLGINNTSAIAFDVNQMNGLVISGNLMQSQNSSSIGIRSLSANIVNCVLGPNLKTGPFAAGTVTPCSTNQNLVAPSGI